MITADARAGAAARRAARERFVRARRAETSYARQLARIARHVGDIVRGIAPGGEVDMGRRVAIERAMAAYADLLRPWANAVGHHMLVDVSRRDEQAWIEAGREMGRNLRDVIAGAPVGAVMRERLAEQVHLITSLPREAAQRVHHLAVEAQINGTRAAQISEEILRSGDVTRSRAMTIARTEVARSVGALTEARAVHVGSEGYIWRTSRDSDVRESHREMEGRYVRWDTMPTLSDGTKCHAGGIYNCRCWSEPVIPDDF